MCESRALKTAVSNKANVTFVCMNSKSFVFYVGRHQMAYESWREQVEEGEQKGRDGEIGSVFLIDRGEVQSIPNNVADDGLPVLSNCSFFPFQMWTTSLPCAPRWSMKDWWMTSLKSNVVRSVSRHVHLCLA